MTLLPIPNSVILSHRHLQHYSTTVFFVKIAPWSPTLKKFQQRQWVTRLDGLVFTQGHGLRNAVRRRYCLRRSPAVNQDRRGLLCRILCLLFNRNTFQLAALQNIEAWGLDPHYQHLPILSPTKPSLQNRGVMIALCDESDSRSAISKRLKIRHQIRIQAQNYNTSIGVQKNCRFFFLLDPIPDPELQKSWKSDSVSRIGIITPRAEYLAWQLLLFSKLLPSAETATTTATASHFGPPQKRFGKLECLAKLLQVPILL